jgi:hypothetical protein
MEFIESAWFPPKYKMFSYTEEHDGVNGKTKQDLPLQMYCVLRSAMVHSFSMIPETALWDDGRRSRSTSPTKYARKGSIVICHEKSGNTHLSKYQDAACFVAEEFLKDIRFAIKNIFDKAQAEQAVADRIQKVMSARPPISVLELTR